MINYIIAGIKLSIDINAAKEKTEYIHNNFKDFEMDSPYDAACRGTISIQIINGALPNFICSEQLVDSSYMTVFKTNNGFNITYKQSPGILLNSINVSASHATIFTNSDYNTGCPVTFKEQLSLAIRDLFFTLCPDFGLLPVHSSSVIYRDKVFIFSAPSGTGKTTHTNLWLENTDAVIFNGDVCLLEVNGGKVMAHGIPWCGSSEQYKNASYELGKIFFLKRNPSSFVKDCSPFESIVSLASRSFASNWTREQVVTISNLATSISNINTAATLFCSPDKEALDAVLNYINK